MLIILLSIVTCFLIPSAFSNINPLEDSFPEKSFIITTSQSLLKKSIDIYFSFWKILNFLMFFKEILLAVKLATHPFINSILALAISGDLLIIDIPLDEIFLISDLTISRIISIS